MSVDNDENIAIDCTSDGCTPENHPLIHVKDSGDIKVISKTNEPHYKDYLAAFFDAEQHIKEAELIDPDKNGLLIPSINELRYCSYHVAKALRANTAKEQAIELSRAERHCMRASYDALELGVITYLDNIHSLIEPFRAKVVIGDVIADYSEKKVLMHQAQEILKLRSGKDKEEHFSEILSLLKDLKKIYAELDSSLDDLTMKLIEHKDKNFSSKIVIYLSGIATAAAVVTAYATFSTPAPQKIFDTKADFTQSNNIKKDKSPRNE